jgi:hypothetical protein
MLFKRSTTNAGEERESRSASQRLLVISVDSAFSPRTLKEGQVGIVAEAAVARAAGDLTKKSVLDILRDEFPGRQVGKLMVEGRARRRLLLSEPREWPPGMGG